ncbi:hypothetical protein F0327_26250 [Citrobacter braakii]|nr:hypothetical protein F0327_26250 [Citrobacter braakii]
MAEEKFPCLKRANELYHSTPRPVDLLDQLEALAEKTGSTTPEARMIGGLISAAMMDEANGHS